MQDKIGRDWWTFDYTAARLAESAILKRDAHAKKLEWWEKKKKEIIQKVAETGIDIQDSVAANYSNTKGNFGPQIVIDAGLQRDLSECQQKILEHDSMTRIYNGWAQVLAANPEKRLSLTHDDYIFFFGE